MVWSTDGLNLEAQDNPGLVLARVAEDPQHHATSCSWLETNHTQFVVGHASTALRLYDSTTASLVHTYLLPSPLLTRLAAHPHLPLLATAHDTGALHLFDLTSGAPTHSLTEAHTTSKQPSSSGVSSVLFSASGLQVITGGHDGSVRVWDVRQSASPLVCEAGKKHMRKYDEGVMCLAAHSNSPFVASGGADSLVNIFEMNNMQ